MPFLFFFFNDTATTEIYTLSLHDALPIWLEPPPSRLELPAWRLEPPPRWRPSRVRSEEHTSELQSPCNLVCRLLLEKKKHARSAHLNRRSRGDTPRSDVPSHRTRAARALR